MKPNNTLRALTAALALMAAAPSSPRAEQATSAQRAAINQLLDSGAISAEEAQEFIDENRSAEAGEKAPDSAVYKFQYESLPSDIKSRASWEAISKRLLANHSEKLKLAQSMQGGGEFIGIDKEGKALFKDKGVEPVMFGFDEQGKPVRIYDRNAAQMGKVVKWANYFEVRGQVKADGFELFSDDGDFHFGDEMNQAQNQTHEPFVASKNRNERRVTWLESGDSPAAARQADFDPNDGRVVVLGVDPERRDGYSGAVRLLRV